MAKRVLPFDLVGHFFGVGSLNEKEERAPLEYIPKLKVPYAYQIPSKREEDMIRQFGAYIDGFEEEGDFILDIDPSSFQEMIENDDPISPSKDYFGSLFLLKEQDSFDIFKTQVTAPATMCFSTRGSNGKNHVSPQMFAFYSSLISRVSQGMVEFLEDMASTTIICQDDPAFGFIREMIENKQIHGLDMKKMLKKTDSLYPERVIPAYHYCEDWRELKIDEEYILWNSKPKIVHIDVVAYDTSIDSEQAEEINHFLQKGGALALGVLPNTDDGYDASVLVTLEHNLSNVLHNFVASGVNLDLLKESCMVSTQCGLKGASKELIIRIHEMAGVYPTAFDKITSRVEK